MLEEDYHLIFYQKYFFNILTIQFQFQRIMHIINNILVTVCWVHRRILANQKEPAKISLLLHYPLYGQL